MKVIILFTGLFILSISSYTQTLKLNDLIYIYKCIQLSDVDDYLTSKGYFYKGSNVHYRANGVDIDDTVQNWEYINNNNSQWCMRVLDGKNRPYITYAMNNQNIALSIKNEIKQLGYILTMTKEVEGTIVSIYTSHKYKIIFLRKPSESQINICSMDYVAPYEK